jgi:hypothetical protein
MKSKSNPQCGRPSVGDAFNLVSQTTGDGERIARELCCPTLATNAEAARLKRQTYLTGIRGLLSATTFV